MAFPTFTIRDMENHSVIDCDFINLRIKEIYNLDHINYSGEEDEYCQFFFKDLEESSGFQKSISWAGLIHTIIDYSDIGYGPATIYDIEAAAEYVRLYLIHFPKSGSMFLSEILKYLNEWGYYIFVEVHSDHEEVTDCFFSEDNSSFLIVTDMGLCICSQDGDLIQVIPSLQNNYLYSFDWPKEIKRLDPELSRNIQNGNSDLPQYIIDRINHNIHKLQPIRDEGSDIDNELPPLEDISENKCDPKGLKAPQPLDKETMKDESEERLVKQTEPLIKSGLSDAINYIENVEASSAYHNVKQECAKEKKKNNRLFSRMINYLLGK